VNRRAIGWILGGLCLLLAAALLVPAGVSFFYREAAVARAFGESAALAAVAGVALRLCNRHSMRTPEGRPAFFRREGMAVVALAWFVTSAMGALPFLLCGEAPSLVDALFESTSGFTTTGATVFSAAQVDALSRGIAFWRCFSHWIGGVGIVLVFVAIMPTGGRSLYRSEGISREEDQPRVRDIAVAILRVYVVLTAVHVLLLWAAGLSPFDSVVHAFSTMATGGFSNHGESIAYYRSPVVELICVVFMIAAGTSFTIWNTLWRGGPKLALGKALQSSELKLYLGLLAGGTAFLWLMLWFWGGSNGQPGSDLPDYSRFLLCGRDAAFSLTSILTCTGYATADFDRWPEVGRMLLVVAAFVGACGGSTGGGVKVFRFLIVTRAAFAAVRSFVSPRAVVRVSADDKPLEPEVIASAARYFVLWVLAAIVGSLLLALLGSDLVTSVTSVVSCLNNVGPGLAAVGPSASFGHLDVCSKLVLCVLMVLGRLEFYALVALFMPSFWRR